MSAMMSNIWSCQMLSCVIAPTTRANRASRSRTALSADGRDLRFMDEPDMNFLLLLMVLAIYLGIQHHVAW